MKILSKQTHFIIERTITGGPHNCITFDVKEALFFYENWKYDCDLLDFENFKFFNKPISVDSSNSNNAFEFLGIDLYEIYDKNPIPYVEVMNLLK